MLPKLASRTAEPGFGATYYQRHRPEQTLFYQIIEQHYPAFTEQLAAHGTALPGYVQREFEDYLKCGRLEHGFLRFLFASRQPPAASRQPPGDHGSGAGYRLPCHRHASDQEGRLYEKDCPDGRGDVDPAVWVRTQPEYPLPHAVPGWRLSRQRHRQTLPACEPEDQFGDTLGLVAGFSLHAGVAAKAHERDKLERLCRYISRPAISEKRLSLTSGGKVRYQLKTPYRDGTTYVIFEPLDFIARLAALVPKPRVNLTRFHGVFAPNSKYRALVTPARRGKVKKAKALSDSKRSNRYSRPPETNHRRKLGNSHRRSGFEQS
ncbi:Mobile element protein [hydrothermal vent metagenome]|uniref:Mobile element protein n=1 Tax=hydrothermal vent metagenome TaxID=652676 RepID=A0A3B0YQ14_9ZZZZ